MSLYRKLLNGREKLDELLEFILLDTKKKIMYIFDQYKQLNLFCCNDKNNKLTPLQMDKENLTKLVQSEKNNPSCKIHYSTFHFK